MVKFIELGGTIYNIDDIARISKDPEGKARIYISGDKNKFWMHLEMSHEEVMKALGPLLFNKEEYNQFISIKK